MTNTTQPTVISWPLEGIDDDGRWSYANDEESVQQVIRNILLTRPGERLMRSDFGAGLMDFIHQPNNQTTRNLMANVVKKSIQHWETRVNVESVEVLPVQGSLTVVQILIRYQMRFTGAINQLNLSLALNQV
ncbi:GPW/gp25 family protein [Aliikangiella marina]|uniref:GPW/gp25 family protein n=1 Tax=Aliikangiella marina TaxID=1712262 RepID=A0A545T2R0_9GAMM|nr:GPW/gp25 family protein [Aliikangiella marina]TQV71504.1 GPW/gp25 family protein [Aliikangiella marina]